MSVNLLELVQLNLGYPALQKIDPNTQKMVIDEQTPVEDKFSQAAIPAVLTGLYKFVQTDEGATAFLQSDDGTSWMNKIFDDNKNEAIQTISVYTGQKGEDLKIKMNIIATEAVKIVKENLPADAAIKDVKTFFTDQKNNILLYLPAALNMGELLHEDALDDGTNKMEGPVSSLIKNIGESFSGSDTGDENKEIKNDAEKVAEQNY